MVVLVDGASDGDTFLGADWEGEEVNGEVVVCPRRVGGSACW